MKRKTIRIEELKSYFQSILDNTINSQGEKKIVCTIYEEILHRTGNYKGYSNQYWMEKGYIEWNEDGCPRGEDGCPLKYYYGPEYDRLYH